jgi:hypothetical protein
LRQPKRPTHQFRIQRISFAVNIARRLFVGRALAKR